MRACRRWSTPASKRCSSSARARPSSACSSRRWRCARSGASSALRGRRRRAAGALPRGREPRAVGRSGCAAFADTAARSASRMIIGEERAVDELWAAAGALMPAPREDRPGQPVYTMTVRLRRGHTGLRPATVDDLDRLLPACAAAHELELGIDPRRRDEDGFRWRVRSADRGRPLVAVARGRRDPLQGRGVGVDAGARCRSSRSGSIPRRAATGYAKRGLRDLIRLLLDSTPVVTLFVRTDNAPAIRLYESIGMRHVLVVPEHPLPVKRAFFARHGESEYSVARPAERRRCGARSGSPTAGVEQARRARPRAARGAARPLHHDRPARASSMTADVALEGRDVPRLVVPELNDPLYGPYEGNGHRGVPRLGRRTRRRPTVPGDGGESRYAIVERYVSRLPRRAATGPRSRSSSSRTRCRCRTCSARSRASSPARACRSFPTRSPTASPPRSSNAAIGVLEGWLAAPTW